MLLTVFPPSLSRGTTCTVRPREEASEARPSINRARPSNKICILNLSSISASQARSESEALANTKTGR